MKKKEKNSGTKNSSCSQLQSQLPASVLFARVQLQIPLGNVQSLQSSLPVSRAESRVSALIFCVSEANLENAFHVPFPRIGTVEPSEENETRQSRR